VVTIAMLLLLGACGNDAAPTTTTLQTTTSVPTTFATTTLDEITTTSLRPTTTTTAPPTVQAQRGGTVVLGQRTEPVSINPLVDGSAATRRIAELHLVGVSDIGPDGRRRPEVVADLPTVANGGLIVNEDGTMTVRYEILPGAVWADGTPMTGGDFAFTYETLLGLEGYSPGFGADAGLYEQIIPGSVTATETTFEFAMGAPTVQHELLFDVLLPRHQVEGTDVLADWNQIPWVSGGPFQLERWDAGSSMTFVRNEAYWRSDGDGVLLPYLESVVVRFIADPTRLVDAFRVGDVDVIAPPASSSVVDALGELTPSGAAVYALPGTVWEQIAFQFGERNRNQGTLNDDVRFRRAVAYAVDRETIADALAGPYGEPLDSYLDVYRPETPGSGWAAYGYDPAEARRLVAEVCVARNLPCDIDPPVVVLSTTADSGTRTLLAESLTPMLADAGIGVRLELEDTALFFGETLLAGTWDLGIWGWEAGPGLTPLVRAHDLWDAEGSPPYGINYQRWGTGPVTDSELVPTPGGPVDVDQGRSTVIDQHTARFATIRDRMQGIVDEQALLSLVEEAEALLADQVVFVPLAARLWVGAVWANRVGGYVPNVYVDTWNVERWFVLDLPLQESSTSSNGAED
jgi:ABC-type transport system substrate-binding protein